VKGFFIISGFYMALVISTRYYALPVGDFYASRLLRLVPLYWVIGLLTVAAELWLVPHGQQFHKLVSPVANVSELDLGSLPSAPGLRGLFVMGLVQWSPLKNVPVWPRHILTIILVIIVAFLLDRLLILPIDRLRLKFGAKPRIDSSPLEQGTRPANAVRR
jgi:peptidoglycan/LPS O-acetylase OafA/YrhL